MMKVRGPVSPQGFPPPGGGAKMIPMAESNLTCTVKRNVFNNTHSVILKV